MSVKYNFVRVVFKDKNPFSNGNYFSLTLWHSLSMTKVELVFTCTKVSCCLFPITSCMCKDGIWVPYVTLSDDTVLKMKRSTSDFFQISSVPYYSRVRSDKNRVEFLVKIWGLKTSTE